MEFNDEITQVDPSVLSLLSQLNISNETIEQFLKNLQLDQLLSIVANHSGNLHFNAIPSLPSNFPVADPVPINSHNFNNLPTQLNENILDQKPDSHLPFNLNTIAFPNCNFQAIGRTESVIRSTKSFTQELIRISSDGDQTPTYLPLCSPPDIQSKIPSVRNLILNGDGFLSETSTSSSSVDDSNSEATSPKINNKKSRPSTESTSSRHRASYPREFKLVVIEQYFNNGQNKYRTCKEFRITKSMLNGWLQKAEKIRDSRPGSLKSGRSGRRPQFPNIERQLFELLLDHLKKGEKLSNKWIRETAKRLAEDQCSAEELRGMCQFSERWLNNFKKRYHIQSGHQNLCLNHFD